ncbi:Muskelin 1, intracellular mediator containing kelch motif [Actinomortierella ambigua]|nr:Muskelin 1, intracellular mediator containing kelch motif [Actinomortierella ambigua]
MAALCRKRGEYLTALAIMRPKVLDYDVHSCSSFSASYLPENIKVNNPQDQSSRWSSGSNNQMQYIMIKLKKMAIARLRNDHEPETFLLKHKANTVVFPCQYIKIVPLVAWGPNFNFSVWFVEVKGIDDPELVQETYFQYINFRETESVRLCLKHFRQRKLTEAFRELQQRTQIPLEDPLLTELYDELVVKGNFKRAEELMVEAADRHMFDDYSKNYEYKPIWRRLWPKRRNGYHPQLHHHHQHLHPHPDEGPRQRGGHQMCIDTKGGFVYLMGGWDGTRELADFWAYHIPSQEWILISPDTTMQAGPSARSCHKIIYSPEHRAIFLLGRYVDPNNRLSTDLHSDFWRFDIDPNAAPFGRWTKISSNTAAVNGPELIYDHQMCLDPLAQMLYVFGGKIVLPDSTAHHYSGLYSYHIPTGVWRLLRADGSPPPKQDKGVVLRSRIGHSMLYDEVLRGLIIFAGQMNKDYLSDFYVYDIAADRVIEVCKDYNKQGGPEAGFTQRSTISCKGREIYVLSGLVKDRALGAEQVKNSFWVFQLPGQNQMDAIRDVQLALARSKVTGSIGTLDLIMSLGSSQQGPSPSGVEDFGILSMQDRHSANYGRIQNSVLSQGRQSSSSRRRVHDERSGGEQQLATGSTPTLSRMGSARSVSKSTADGRSVPSTSPPLPAHSTRRGSTSTSSQTSQPSLRSVTNGMSPNTASSTRPSTLPGQDLLSTQHNHSGPGSSSSASSSSSSSHPSNTPSNSGHGDRGSRSMATNIAQPMNGFPGDSSAHIGGSGVGGTMKPNDSPLMEPLTLAYVLSDQSSWKKIYQNSSPDLGERGEQEPVPRYAHQLVYDDVNEVQYLFGGNPGEQGNMSKRLDDFWELRLYKPSPEHILRKARYLLRTQQFKELCQRPETCVLTSTTVMTDEIAAEEAKRKRMIKKRKRIAAAKAQAARDGGGVWGLGGVHRQPTTLIQRGTEAHLEQSRRALNFLRTELSGIVDHSNKVENEEFRLLIRGLLVGGFARSTSAALSVSPTTANHMTTFAPLGMPGAGSTPAVAGSQYAGLAQPTNAQPMFAQSSAFHPPRTSVKLASTPVTSPNMSACPRLLLSPNPGAGSRRLSSSAAASSSASTTVSSTTFLTSPKSHSAQSSRFLSLSQLGAPEQTHQQHPFIPNARTESSGMIMDDEDAVMAPATATVAASTAAMPTGGLARDKHDTTDGVVPRDPNNATPEEDEEAEDDIEVDMDGRHHRREGSGKGRRVDDCLDGTDDDSIHDDDNDDDDDDNDHDDHHDSVAEGEESEEDEDEDDHGHEGEEEEEWIEGVDEEQDRVMRACTRDRMILYEKLLDFFAEEMRQPKGDLIDLVKVG